MVRMKYVVQYSATFDATWDSVDIVVWSTIEQFTAMLCGSLPALRPLFIVVWSTIEHFTAMLCVRLPVLRPLLARVAPGFSADVRGKACRGKRNLTHSSVQVSAHATTKEPEKVIPDCAGSPVQGTDSSDNGGVKIVKTIDLSQTWFDDSSHHSAEDVGCCDPPQQPPPPCSKSEGSS